MNALLWKKLKELTNNKKKVSFVLLLLIITSVVLIVYPIKIRNTMLGLPLFNSILFWMILFSVEDFVFAEAILGTKISIKDMWFGNIIMINLFSAICSILQMGIILSVTKTFYQIKLNNILDSIIAFTIGLGLTAFATFYISNYSKLRNLISSIGGIVNLIIIGYMVTVMGDLNKVYDYRFYVLGVSIVLLVCSLTIVYNFSSSEKFIMNIKNLGQAYDNSNTIDE